MKLLLALFIFGLPVFASEEKAPVKPQPILIQGAPKALATYNYETQKVSYEKGVDPEQVVDVIMREFLRLSEKYNQLEASCKAQPKVESQKKK